MTAEKNGLHGWIILFNFHGHSDNVVMKKFCFIFILFTMIAITMACSSNGTEEPVDNARYIEEPVKFILHIDGSYRVDRLRATDDSAIKDITDCKRGYFGFTLLKYGTTIFNAISHALLPGLSYPIKITYVKDASGNISYSAECDKIEVELIKDDYVATDIFPIEVRMYNSTTPFTEPFVDAENASMLEIVSINRDDYGYYIDFKISEAGKGILKYQYYNTSVNTFIDAKIPLYSIEKPFQVAGAYASKILWKVAGGTYVDYNALKY